jgi:hypothetical protein
MTQPSVLRFGMGLDPRALDWGSDGATFEVFVDGERVFLEHLPAELAQEGWQEREVDLAAHTGQTVLMTLATTPGPAGDVTGDWAGWGEPRLETPEAAVYRQVARGRPWLTEWKRADITAKDFVSAGESARRAQRYDEAVAWFQWAAQMSGKDPDEYPSLQDDQLFMLESFVTTSVWQRCSWCGDTPGTFETSEGVLRMHYRNSPEQRDGFAYQTMPNVSISQFSELVMNLKGKPGTLLTIELVVDGKRSRPLSYRSVPLEWDTWILPIEGEVLNEILIGIGEPESVPTPHEYRLFLDWIDLR